MKSRRYPITALFTLVILAISVSVQARIIYVKHDASGSGDGHDWPNAITDLQTGINQAVKGDTLFVSWGTYKPSFKFNGDTDRNSTFYINKDIVVYGGFEGVAGTEGHLEAQAPSVHITFLNGDLGVENDTTDNAFHVVYLDHVSDSMRLDGMVMLNGNNFGAAGIDTYGAGLFIDGTSGRCHPVVANCVIRDNHADQAGGGAAVYAQFGGKAHPTFWNCKFTSNVAGGGGGLMCYTDTEGEISPRFYNCFLQGNTARTAQGSAISMIIHSSVGDPLMVNCVVTGNQSNTSSAFETFLTGTGVTNAQFMNTVFAGNAMGSIRISSIGTSPSNVMLRNCILWQNPFNHGLTFNNTNTDVSHSIMQFGFEGEGNLLDDPMFVSPPSSTGTPHLDGDVHLLPGSPGIDTGDNTAVPAGITHDAAGKPRFIDATTGLEGGTVDMGAFEVQEAVLNASTTIVSSDWKIYPNPVSSNLSLNLPEAFKNADVSLWSPAGVRLDVKKADEQDRVHFEVSPYPPGIYYVMLQSGQKIAVSNIEIIH